MGILVSPVFWVASLLLIGFWVVAAFVPNTRLMESMRLVQITISAVVFFAYLPYATDAVLARRPNRIQQLALGIALGFFALAMNGVWSLVWRLSGQPYWMANSDIVGFFVWLSILSATLHITAPAPADGLIPRRNWILLGLSFGVGFASAALILTLAPDLHPIADWLQRLFDEPYPITD